MILYDSKLHKIINIDPINIEIERNGNIGNVISLLKIKFEYSEINYIKDWFNEACSNASTYGCPSEYKRDLFISEYTKMDKKFHGCFIKNIKTGGFDHFHEYESKSEWNCKSGQDNNLIEVEINTDYWEIGDFPELISIYREIKINSILK